MEKKNQPPYLPHELIIQILLRLPVKSLIRFKCVCKSWLTLISDSHFANSQFQLTASTHIHRALFISTTSPYKTRSIDLELSIDDDDDSVSSSRNPPNFMPYQPYSGIEIKGSCRGFILFYSYSILYLYLWNPSTGVQKYIPFGSNLDPYADYFYGFGYDRSTDDYLIVSMSSGTRINSFYLEIFSLRANSWKQIYEGTNIRYSNAIVDRCQAGSVTNGTIHWYAYRRDLGEEVIVAFDLMERKILDMHLPDQFDLQIYYYSCLWVFREFLSIWAPSHRNDAVEIWVMKEYRVHSSWTKTHVLPIDGIPTKYLSPLCCTKSGDIFGIYGDSRLVKYNDEGQLLGHRSYGNNPYGFQVAILYIESLLSLPGDDVQA